MSGTLHFTDRDRELLQALAQRVRLFSQRQVADHLWNGELANARRRLKRLQQAGLVTKVDAGEGRVWISMSKDEIKSAPDYDDLERRYSDDDYDREFGGYYRTLP